MDDKEQCPDYYRDPSAKAGIGDTDAHRQVVTIVGGGDDEPRLRRLIEVWEAKSGAPVLVNTSFNVRGEPIVCTPRDAHTCFMRTHIDALVLGPYILYKEEQKEWKDTGDWQWTFPLD